ncbi:cyclin-dependent kinase 11B-like isoform X2 [Periplaneta americana]|uniref:cyclin-dependent kinase 11B-like isoform X2 n=1 Tax=Periplaneta americana TaxID=6978 RepID=UPI0037E86F13
MSDYEVLELDVDSQSEDETTKDLGFSKLEDEEEDDALNIKPPQASSVHHRKKSSSRSTSSKRRDYSDRDRREHVHGRHETTYRKNHHHQSREYKEYKAERTRDKHHHRCHDTSTRGRDKRHERKHEQDRDRSVNVRSRHGCEHKHSSRGHRKRNKLPNNSGEDLREHLLNRSRNAHSDEDVSEGENGSDDGDGYEGTDQKVNLKEAVRDRERECEPEETAQERAERLEREMRRERFLKAEREMAQRKELYRHELEARRERMNLEKEKERTLEELAKKRDHSSSPERKKLKTEEENQRETDNKNNIITLSDEAEMAQSHSDVEVVEETDGRGNSSAPNEDASSGTDDEGTDGTDSGGDESDSDSHHTDDDDNDEDDDDDDDDAVHNTPSHSSVKEEQESESTGNEKNIPFTSDKNTKLDLAMIEKLPPYLPAIQGCRNVDEFQTLNKIEEGSYGVVFRAMDKHTEEVVALKRLKMDKEKEGFPITSLREINTLLKAQHPNIVTVREIVMGSNMDKIFIVMDYVEHDLKSLMASMKQKNQFFSLGEVKCLMQQLLRAVAHLHDNWILHRDLKTSNLLLSHKGILKVGDFGLAREYGSPLKAYTSLVVTLWYRAPELLLGAKKYSTPIDMWSVGCIFAELLSMEPLFQGKSEAQQLSRIFKTLGTPNEEIWPGFSNLPVVQKVKFVDYPTSQLRTRFSAMISDVGIGLMNRFLTYDPAQRISAEDAIHHDYFMEGPLPIDPSMFPTWPAKSEIGHRNIMAASPKLPSGHEYKGDTSDDIPIEGFHMGVTEKGHVESGPAFRLKF